MEDICTPERVNAIPKEDCLLLLIASIHIQSRSFLRDLFRYLPHTGLNVQFKISVSTLLGRIVFFLLKILSLKILLISCTHFNKRMRIIILSLSKIKVNQPILFFKYFYFSHSLLHSSAIKMSVITIQFDLFRNTSKNHPTGVIL